MLVTDNLTGITIEIEDEIIEVQEVLPIEIIPETPTLTLEELTEKITDIQNQLDEITVII